MNLLPALTPVVRVWDNPLCTFDDDSLEPLYEYQPNLEICMRDLIPAECGRAVLVVNGVPLMQSEWHRPVLPGDVIEWHLLAGSKGTSRTVLTIIAIIAIAYFTGGLGASGYSAFEVAALGVGLNLAASLLIHAPIPDKAAHGAGGGGVRWRGWGRPRTSPTSGAMNVAPLMMKTQPGPTAAISRPARPGPIIRDAWNDALFRPTAFERFSIGTSSATKICRTGASSAGPQPTRVAKAPTGQSWPGPPRRRTPGPPATAPRPGRPGGAARPAHGRGGGRLALMDAQEGGGLPAAKRGSRVARHGGERRRDGFRQSR